MNATSGLGRSATTTERESMMRAMLADRFKLVAHVENEGAPGSRARFVAVERVELPADD